MFRLPRDSPLRQRVGARQHQEAGVFAQQEQRRGDQVQAPVSDGEPERGGGGGHDQTHPDGVVQELPGARQVHAPLRRKHARSRDGH